VVLGQITFAETPGATRVTVGPVVAGQGSHTVEAAANGVFNSHIKLDGSSAAPRTKISRPANNLPLIQRVPGSEEPIIEVGHVELAADGIGFSILADLYANPAGAGPAYRFDLDLTSVTAMRGEFKYTLK
jgi:hypothetical protein